MCKGWYRRLHCMTSLKGEDFPTSLNLLPSAAPSEGRTKAVCRQPAEADIRAKKLTSGFDPKRRLAEPKSRSAASH
jgi:hypothetical protein